MGELKPARDVADGVDALVGGAHLVVDGDALLRMLDACLVEIEAAQGCCASRCHKQCIALDLFLAVIRFQRQRDLAFASFFDTGHIRALADIDAFGSLGDVAVLFVYTCDYTEEQTAQP